MQSQHRRRPPPRRPNQISRTHTHRMQPPLDAARPKIQKLLQLRKTRRQIQLLPNKALQNRRMIRHMIKNLRGRDPIVTQLQAKAHDQRSIMLRPAPARTGLHKLPQTPPYDASEKRTNPQTWHSTPGSGAKSKQGQGALPPGPPPGPRPGAQTFKGDGMRAGEVIAG
jgi:hypothetical protein